MRTQIRLICWLLILVAPTTIWATEPFIKVNYGVDAHLLARPNGARGLAMGMTGVADVADPTNVFYNPAVIALVEGIAVTQSYIDWADLPDYKLNAWDLGVAGIYRFPTRGSTTYRLAGSIRYNRQTSDFYTMPRTIFIPSGTGRAIGASNDWYVNLTGAGGVTIDRVDLTVGVSVKPTRVEFGDRSLTGVAFDAGMLARARFGGGGGYRVLPAVGVSVSNLGKSLNNDEGTVGLSVTLPERARLGASVRIETPGLSGAETPLVTITGNGEMVNAIDGDTNNSFYGGEIVFVDVVMLRAGHLADATEGDTTYGLGLAWSIHKVRFGFDYTRAPDFHAGEAAQSYGVWVLVGH
jgi:hypothetical protein